MRRCGHVAENCVYKIGRIVTRVDFDPTDPRLVRVSRFGPFERSAAGAAGAAVPLTPKRMPARATA